MQARKIHTPSKFFDGRRLADVSMALAAVLFLSDAPAQGQLLLPSDQLWHQDTPGVPDAESAGAEPGDRFGGTTISGDFDGDGFDDIATSSRTEEIAGFFDVGSVNVLYGAADGLTVDRAQLWHEGFGGLEGAPADADVFGSALAACDFDGDGRDELAIGVHGKDIGGTIDAGRVHVLYGTEAGLSIARYQHWDEGSTFGLSAPETSGLLGFALACGDFDADDYDDLAIGSPGAVFGVDGGSVTVLYGSDLGLTNTRAEEWSQNTPDVGGSSEDGDFFGGALTTGDFNADGYQDLAIGVYGEDLPSGSNAGVVNVLYGTANGLSSSGSQFLSQDFPGLYCAAPEAGDHFGQALAAGDFNADGVDDLAVGSPGEDVGGTPDSGLVILFDGSASGLFPFAGDRHCVHSAAPLREGTEFGFVLTSGDLNADGIGDLVVGTPYQRLDPDVYGQEGGVLIVFGGTDEAPIVRETLLLTQGTPGVPGDPVSPDWFAHSVAIGDFDGSGFDDLVVGSPRDDVPDISEAGSVNVFYSSVLFVDGFESGDTQGWRSSTN